MLSQNEGSNIVACGNGGIEALLDPGRTLRTDAERRRASPHNATGTKFTGAVIARGIIWTNVMMKSLSIT